MDVKQKHPIYQWLEIIITLYNYEIICYKCGKDKKLNFKSNIIAKQQINEFTEIHKDCNNDS